MDLYRLGTAGADDLGLEELGVQDGVLAIEWPDRLGHGFRDAIDVQIDVVDEMSRRIAVRRAVKPATTYASHLAIQADPEARPAGSTPSGSSALPS